MSEAWCFEDLMSIDVVTMGAVQWSGQQCTLRMRTHLVITKYIGNHRGLRADSNEDTETGPGQRELFFSHFNLFCIYMYTFCFI